jgi:hypothetical protein
VLGGVVSGTCPAKVIFSFSEDVTRVLQYVVQLAKSLACLFPQHINIVSNKTKWKRNLFHVAYADPKRRQISGESDLIVVNTNGISKATKLP